MQAGEPRRTYQTLEGLRAVGALLVATRHVPVFFRTVTPPESFLAVDLFYLVSGFVIAHAYEARLAAGGFTLAFIKTRIIRLYPLYALGMIAGIAGAAIAVIGDPRGWWTAPKLAEAIATGLFLIPLVPGLSANGSSLNGPTWTLLPELIANLVYAVAIRFLNLAALALIVAASGAALVYAELKFGSLDVGYGRDELWCALARVGFSFFAGVMVFRLFGGRMRRSVWAAWACVGALAAALLFDPSDDQTPYFELGLVFVGFPLLLVAAGRFEPGARTGRVFASLGVISYGIYILHQPLGRLAREGLKLLIEIPDDGGAVILGVAFLALLTALTWWLDRAYDAPVRRLLRAKFLPPPKQKAQRETSGALPT